MPVCPRTNINFMLITARKPWSEPGEFIIPYLIQTDSKRTFLSLSQGFRALFNQPILPAFNTPLHTAQPRVAAAAVQAGERLLSEAPQLGEALTQSSAGRNSAENEPFEASGGGETDAFFALSREICCIFGPTGRLLSVNQVFCALLGYSKEELLGVPYASLLDPSDRPYRPGPDFFIPAKPGPLSFENRFIARDGSIRKIAWTATLLKSGGLLSVGKLLGAHPGTHPAGLLNPPLQDPEQINTVLDSITEGYFLLDQNLHVLFCNHKAAQILEQPALSLAGSSVEGRLPPFMGADTVLAFKKAGQEKSTFTREYYVPRQGRWLEMNTYPVSRDLFVYFKDVSRRKFHEMLLELEKKVLEINSNQQASLPTTVDYFLEGIEKIFPGMLCSVLLVSEDGSTLHHLSAPSLPKPYCEAINGINAGPSACSCGTAAYTKKAVIVSDIASDPLWATYRDLAAAYNLAACWSLPILDNSGQVLATFAMYYSYVKSPNDLDMAVLVRAANLILIILESKRAEEKIKISNERYLLAIKATNDVIWDLELKSQIPFWSEGFYTQFGFKSGKEVNTRGFWEAHLHPEDARRVIDGLTAFIGQKKRGLWLEEYRFRKANGKYVLISNRGFLIFDKNGQPVRMVGSMQDITEKRAMEQKLLQQELNKQKMIVQAVVDAQERERAEIGKELHDNVNQILSTTKLYLELAGSDEAERTNLIARSAKNITQAITEIRNISRSLVPPSIGDLGLLDSIHDLIENIRAIKAIHIEFYPVGDFDSRIGDQQKLMLFRIIQEQVNNVLKHSEARNLIIELVLVEAENRIELFITDDGRGFEPSRIKGKKGMGLSNIISRADLFGGKVSIVSAEGEGCKLNVQIPINNL